MQLEMFQFRQNLVWHGIEFRVKFPSISVRMQNLAHIRGSVELPLSFCFFLPRNVLGTKNLGDILSERESIANMMQSTLVKIEKKTERIISQYKKSLKLYFYQQDEATDPWGVKVERVEVWVLEKLHYDCYCLHSKIN